MSDPLDKASARSVPVVGGVCTLRYQVEEMEAGQGADFSGAPALLALSRHAEAADEEGDSARSAGNSPEI